jgi:hypothetical protein
MVPLIFEAFAADLAQRAASLSPSAVLEIAAGRGCHPRIGAKTMPRRKLWRNRQQPAGIHAGIINAQTRAMEFFIACC